MAKAPAWNGSDGEGRKLGERSGLDTPVHEIGYLLIKHEEKSQVIQKLGFPNSCGKVLAVNDALLVLQASRELAVPERRC